MIMFRRSFRLAACAGALLASPAGRAPGGAGQAVNSAPDIALERTAGGSLQDGGTLTLAPTPAGHPAIIAFTVRNPGGSHLSGLAVTFDGPDASEFSVTQNPAASVAPGDRTVFIVRHTPLVTGFRTASLHLASNVAGSKNPFDITLRMGEPGMLDQSFTPLDGTYPWCLAVKPDRRIFAGFEGGLQSYNFDGSFDTAFFTPPANDVVQAIALLKDGNFLVGGSFTSLGGFARQGFGKLSGDGSFDMAFDAGLQFTGHAAFVTAVAVQPDGKILAGGGFDTVAGQPQPRLARLHPDGSLDAGFRPVIYGTPFTIVLQDDGKILVGMSGSNVPAGEGPVVRLHPDGTRDNFSLPVPNPQQAQTYCLAVQPDGKIIAGGPGHGGLVRCFPDGTLDVRIPFPPDSAVFALALQAGGKCIAAGGFRGDASNPFPHTNIALINPDGSVDPSFTFPMAQDEIISSVLLQADGGILVGGIFSSVGGGTRDRFARLLNSPAFDRLAIHGVSTVRWTRSGSAPEVSGATFDVKPDGSPDWTPLGAAHRIPGGWELSALTLPAAGTLRAQAYAGGSIMETVTPILTPLEYWRLQYFNTPANTGPAADDADPDHDGLTNFTEFAFGLSPVDHTSNTLPEFKYDGISFTAAFTAPEGRENVTYTVESSPTMQPGTWSPVPDSGIAGMHKFVLPATASRLFWRFPTSIR